MLCEPENYEHVTVDKALNIEVIKNYNLIREKAINKNRQKKLKEAQERICNHEDT